VARAFSFFYVFPPPPPSRTDRTRRVPCPRTDWTRRVPCPHTDQTRRVPCPHTDRTRRVPCPHTDRTRLRPPGVLLLERRDEAPPGFSGLLRELDGRVRRPLRSSRSCDLMSGLHAASCPAEDSFFSPPPKQPAAPAHGSLRPALRQVHVGLDEPPPHHAGRGECAALPSLKVCPPSLRDCPPFSFKRNHTLGGDQERVDGATSSGDACIP
jgi:hypothetical protein